MPLNINDRDEGRNDAPLENQFSPPPASGTPDGSRRRLLLWVFLVIVLLSAIFLLLQFGVIPSGANRVKGGPAANDSAGPASTTETLPQETAESRTEEDRAAELRRRLSEFDGEYTIFISALRDSADAGELAGRWERAGYPTCILHSSGWYRVGVGKYATPALARSDAEKLRQALEEGYWIGRSGL